MPPGVRAARDLNADALYNQNVIANNAGAVFAPAICFADGDALTSICSSINLTYNGTSLSLNRTNRFWRDWQRTQVSSEDSARIYKSCGGPYDASDAVGVCTPMYRDNAASTIDVAYHGQQAG